MANNDIIELLDILYGMVTEAWSVPLGNDKCIIEREKAIEIINEIKNSLPTAIAEAQRLVSARDEFIGNAKREAEALRKNPDDASAMLMLAELYLKERGAFEIAEILARHSLSIKAQPRAWKTLAGALRAQGREAEAAMAELKA